MPSLGPLEILVVAAVALIVFGPEKLPDIARTVGRAASQMRRMASEFREEFETGLELDEDEEAVTPTPVRRSTRSAATRPDPDGGRAGRGPGTRRPEGDPAPPAREVAEPIPEEDPSSYGGADLGHAVDGRDGNPAEGIPEERAP